MDAQVHNVTAASDIVVELRGVCKTFRQKQRSERLRDTNVLVPLFHGMTPAEQGLVIDALDAVASSIEARK